MRLIDAEELEELFRETITGIANKTNRQGVYEHMMRASAMVIEMIKDAPTIEAEPRWIPVTERLPEENMRTICQNNVGAMMIGKYDIEFGWMFPAYFDGIDAWMPLPEPYKEVEE